MESQVVRCPSCGQANRVPALAGGKRAVCGKCQTTLPVNGNGGGPLTLTDANFQETIASGKTVVDFWAGWCGPCHMMAPGFEQLAGERTDVRFGKLNIDEQPRIADQFNVRSIPTLIFFRDGREVGRKTGAIPKPAIESLLAQFLG
jgi:thioredoxin 2